MNRECSTCSGVCLSIQYGLLSDYGAEEVRLLYALIETWIQKHIVLVIFTVSMIVIRCGVVVVGNEGYNAVNAKPTNRRGGYKIGEW